MLRAILSLPAGKLNISEKKSFQGMYDQLVAGMMIGLSKKQRAWADSVYASYDLDRERPAARPVAVLDKSLLKGKKP